jgi:hypothetical protein
MQHFRSNPPSRQIAPQPLFVATYASVRTERAKPECLASGKGLSQLRRLEAFMKARKVAPSSLGRMVAKDPRLVFDLRKGTQPRAALANKITAFFAIVEFEEADNA